MLSDFSLILATSNIGNSLHAVMQREGEVGRAVLREGEREGY